MLQAYVFSKRKNNNQKLGRCRPQPPNFLFTISLNKSIGFDPKTTWSCLTYSYCIISWLLEDWSNSVVTSNLIKVRFSPPNWCWPLCRRVNMFFGQQILLSTHFLGDVQILREQIKPYRMLIIMKEHIAAQNKTPCILALFCCIRPKSGEWWSDHLD